MCLSSLLAAGRHQEIWDLLAIARFPFWPDRKFGVQALVADGRMDDAVAWAEASRGLNQPNGAIDIVCEQILRDADRVEEAYQLYALTATQSSTGLATFRALCRKYPGRDPKQVLLDLANTSGDCGRWFAAAKDAGFIDLAIQFAKEGQTDPRTLSRASRDFIAKDPKFSLIIGRLALERMLRGFGYDITDVLSVSVGHTNTNTLLNGTTYENNLKFYDETSSTYAVGLDISI